jgi:transcriptional regulator with XRE-family HTH domain
MQLRSREALIVCLEATGMSERQLSRVAGLSHSTVNHLVTGRRTSCTLRTARAIERTLGVAAGILFDDVEVPIAHLERQLDGQR